MFLEENIRLNLRQSSEHIDNHSGRTIINALFTWKTILFIEFLNAFNAYGVFFSTHISILKSQLQKIKEGF